jgi:uncharacterized CHY-type Zn-finger protein
VRADGYTCYQCEQEVKLFKNFKWIKIRVDKKITQVAICEKCFTKIDEEKR